VDTAPGLFRPRSFKVCWAKDLSCEHKAYLLRLSAQCEAVARRTSRSMPAVMAMGFGWLFVLLLVFNNLLQTDTKGIS
jgi:hypothetical protein